MVVVQTTHAPATTDPTAVMGRRILAFLIDAVIGIALAVILFASVADSATFASSDQAERICDIVQEDSDNTVCFNAGDRVWVAEGEDTALIVIVLLAYGVFFHFLLPGVAGYTIGKAIMGLRVVKHETGQLAGLGASGVRWILWVADGQPCGVPLVGLITGLASKGHRRVGDMAAGTVVVEKAMVGQLLSIPGLDQPTPEPAPWTPPPVSPPPGGGPAVGDAAPPHSAVPNTPPAFPPPTTPPLQDAPVPPGPGDGPPPPPAPAGPVSEPEDDTTEAEAPSDDAVADETVGAATEAAIDEAAATADAATETAAAAADAETATDEAAAAAETATDEAAADADVATDEAATAADAATETIADATEAAADATEASAAAGREPLPERPTDDAALGSTETAAPAAPRPGVDAPQWDNARNTYIQWDPQLGQWMEWSEAQGKWVPIST